MKKRQNYRVHLCEKGRPVGQTLTTAKLSADTVLGTIHVFSHWLKLYLQPGIQHGTQQHGIWPLASIQKQNNFTATSNLLWYTNRHNVNNYTIIIKIQPINVYLNRPLLGRPNMGQMSVRPQKRFSDSDEIWYVGRGRWVMHDGMPYDPIQGQGQGHETFKVRFWKLKKTEEFLSPPAFLMWAGNW